MIKSICKRCEKEFLIYKCRISQKRGKYCSRRCYALDQKGHAPSGFYIKGEAPWNKGKKREYSLPTQHKIGSITIRKDANGKKRRWIKIGHPSKWIQYSHYIFRKHTRINTFNKIIHHLDKNPLNDTFKNLQIVSRSDHMKLHLNKERKLCK